MNGKPKADIVNDLLINLRLVQSFSSGRRALQYSDKIRKHLDKADCEVNVINL